AAINAEAVMQLRERRIGLVVDEFAQACLGSRVEFAFRHAAMRLGLHGAGTALALQQAYDEGEADGEHVCDLADRQLTAFDGGDDTLAKVVRIWSHGSTSLEQLPKRSFTAYPVPVQTALEETLIMATAYALRRILVV